MERRADLRVVVEVPARVIPAAAPLDLPGGEAEEEEVLLAGRLGHLDGGAVARPQGERAVHHELHVGRATRLVAGGGDLVGDVGRGDEPLGQGDVVLREEEDLQPPLRDRVPVDGAGQVAEELDDDLGEPVGRRGLAGEEEGPRGHLQPGVPAQAVVQHHDAQAVQELPLVLVDALHLAVEDRLRIHHLARRALQPVGEACLLLPLGHRHPFPEGRVVGQRAELLELREVGHPPFPDRPADHLGEGRIAEPQPASGGHPVGLVVEALGEQLGQVPDGALPEEFGVDGGDPVRAVGSDDGQVGHADPPDRALLDQARPGHPALVSGEAGANLVDQPAVHLQDDVEVARNDRREPLERPPLQRLREERVVRVGERPAGEVPGVVPGEPRVVEQDSHQLGHGHGRVGVVELDRDLLGERVPVAVAGHEAAQDVGERAGHQEVLLDEAQRLPGAGRVVRVQDPGERFRGEGGGQRRDEVPLAEGLEVEGLVRARRPETQGVDVLPTVAHHRPVVGDAVDGGRPPRNGLQGPALDLVGAVDVDLDPLERTAHLPRVRVAEPVVGVLHLPAVLQGLAEHAVLVAKPVARGRELQRGHGVEEAGRQPAQAAVAEPGVGLLLDQVPPVDPLLVHLPPDEGGEPHVGHVVGERPAEQVLHRQVVDPLRVLPRVVAVRGDPALGQDVADRVGRGLEAFPVAGRLRVHHRVEEEVPFVEGVVGAGELHRAAPVVGEELLVHQVPPRPVAAAASTSITARSERTRPAGMVGSPAARRGRTGAFPAPVTTQRILRARSRAG